MSDYMVQKADDQIEGGNIERESLYAEIEDFEIKRKAVLEYCYDNLAKMWAAKVAGILLGCDFRDAKEHSDIYFENEGIGSREGTDK